MAATEKDCTVCIRTSDEVHKAVNISDAGRRTGVTDTYGANINADVTTIGKPSATFKESIRSSDYA